MKYIPADKLIAEIERLKEKAQAERVLHPQTILSAKNYLLIQDYDTLLSIITSLQQEQPDETCKTCRFYENNCPFIRGKLIPYPSKVCKDYTEKEVEP